MVSDESASNPEGAGTMGSLFRYMFACAGVAMIATDRELKIRGWNSAAMRIFGASASQMVGTDCLGVVPQRRREIALKVLKRAIENGEPNEFEFQHRDEKGMSRELAVTVTPIADDAGTRLGVLICVRDITRRVEAVAEALESQKMASLGEMAGEVAHHFNNILGGVVTSVDYALSGDEYAVCRRVLEQTAWALGRATHLVRGLLAFAEGDSEHQDQCDLTELILSVVQELEQRAAEQGVTLKLDLPELPVLPVPRDPVTTVLENLTQNALDAMPDGGDLTVEVRPENDRVLIRICDTGRGLQPAELKRVFEPFYRAKDPSAKYPSRDREGAGAPSFDSDRRVGDGPRRPVTSSPARAPAGATGRTGLGLAVAFGIMRHMGGSISARSAPKKGSCFEVSIPT